jgi:DNA-directed RNA polymerase subunit RPC12/RpoP
MNGPDIAYQAGECGPQEEFDPNQEADGKFCPYCASQHTAFLQLDPADSDWAHYICMTCDTQFKLYNPIPF